MRSLLLVVGCLALYTASCADDDGTDENRDTGGRPPTGGAESTGGNGETGGRDDGAGGEAPGAGGTAAGAGGAAPGAGGVTAPEPPQGGTAGEPEVAACGSLGASMCDPLTGSPCDLDAGETCDYIGEEGFVCIPGPNDAVLCGECGESSGLFCGAGTNCNFSTERCEKFCCADSDCETGVCNQGLFDGEGLELVGICSEEAAETCE